MTLRLRLTLATGAAVLVALAVASLVIFVSVRSKLHDQIDVSLIQNAQNTATKIGVAGSAGYPATPTFVSGAAGYLQIIPSVGALMKFAATASGKSQTPSTAPLSTANAETSTGQSTQQTSTQSLGSKTSTQEQPGPRKALPTPNSFVVLAPRDEAVASGVAPPYFRDATFHGTAIRLYTMRLTSSSDGLVRSARPLTEANATVGRVRWLLIALTLGGAVAAALLGRLAAASVLRPVRRLAGVVQEVTTTRDLGQRIPVQGRDEVASLGENFNQMLTALEESQRIQLQLIADASHELRTPLTAHRANVELLARPDLPLDRRPGVLTAAMRGIEELSTLVSDLIQAARAGTSVDTRVPVALDELVARVLERATHRGHGARFVLELEPCMISAAPTRLERAVDNVIDNAIKWSPEGAAIEVRLSSGLLTIRDHGPGIDAADLPHLFDRFYRAPAARGLPGSGLGLAIVKQTIDDHGGSVSIANAADGGAIVSICFDALTNS